MNLLKSKKMNRPISFIFDLPPAVVVGPVNVVLLLENPNYGIIDNSSFYFMSPLSFSTNNQPYHFSANLIMLDAVELFLGVWDSAFYAGQTQIGGVILGPNSHGFFIRSNFINSWVCSSCRNETGETFTEQSIDLNLNDIVTFAEDRYGNLRILVNEKEVYAGFAQNIFKTNDSRFSGLNVWGHSATVKLLDN